MSLQREHARASENEPVNLTGAPRPSQLARAAGEQCLAMEANKKRIRRFRCNSAGGESGKRRFTVGRSEGEGGLP